MFKNKNMFFIIKKQYFLLILFFLFLFIVAVPNVFAASLSYSGDFTEVSANDGSLAGSRVITLVGDTFVDPITLNTHLTVTNLPTALTAVLSRDSSTQITITLTGNADDHLDANDISNLTITFLDGAFVTEATASNVTGYINSAGEIDFNDQASLSYVDNFSEVLANDGSVIGMRVITLTGDTFVNAGASLTESVHYVLNNKPAGLIPIITVSGTGGKLDFSFTGNADNHRDIDDISNLTITFLDGAFTNTTLASNVDNYTDANGIVAFNDQAFLSHSSTITETLANDGSVSGSEIIILSDDAFVNPIILDTHLTVSNLPSGLSAVINRDSDTQLSLTLIGQADNHLDADDISNLRINFLNCAFVNTTIASNVDNYIDETGTIDFHDQPLLTYSSNITETEANDGSVSGTETITLNGDTFVNPIILGTHLNVTNIPIGLTASITRDSDTQLSLSLTGNADNHVDLYDVYNLTVSFLDGAFINTTTASNVNNYIDSNGTIDFNNTMIVPFRPANSSGGGSFDTMLEAAQESDIKTINIKGVNFLLCLKSKANFMIEGDKGKFYSAKIEDLNLVNKQIVILFSNGELMNLSINELALIDLDGDRYPDVLVKYNDLKNNLIDLTFTKVIDNSSPDEADKDIDEVVVKDFSEETYDDYFSYFKNTSLVKEFNRPTIYLLKDGEIRSFLNQTVFYSYGFSWDDIKEYDNLSEYPRGKTITLTSEEHRGFMNGDLLKEKDNNNIYLFENGKRRRILDENVFNKNGFSKEEIYELEDLSMFPLGKVLDIELEKEQELTISGVFNKYFDVLMEDKDIKHLRNVLRNGFNVSDFEYLIKAAVAGFNRSY